MLLDARLTGRSSSESSESSSSSLVSSPSSSKSVFPPGLSAHRCSKSPPDQKLSSASFCSLRFADSLSSSTVVGFVFSSSSSLSSPSPVSTTTTSLGEATKERFPPPRFAAADVVRTAAHRPETLGGVRLLHSRRRYVPIPMFATIISRRRRRRCIVIIIVKGVLVAHRRDKDEDKDFTRFQLYFMLTYFF